MTIHSRAPCRPAFLFEIPTRPLFPHSRVIFVFAQRPPSLALSERHANPCPPASGPWTASTPRVFSCQSIHSLPQFDRSSGRRRDYVVRSMGRCFRQEIQRLYGSDRRPPKLPRASHAKARQALGESRDRIRGCRMGCHETCDKLLHKYLEILHNLYL